MVFEGTELTDIRNACLEAARKAEFKGRKKKALDQCQDALHFLYNDEIDDSLQAEKIVEGAMS